MVEKQFLKGLLHISRSFQHFPDIQTLLLVKLSLSFDRRGLSLETSVFKLCIPPFFASVITASFSISICPIPNYHTFQPFVKHLYFYSKKYLFLWLFIIQIFFHNYMVFVSEWPCGQAVQWTCISFHLTNNIAIWTSRAVSMDCHVQGNNSFPCYPTLQIEQERGFAWKPAISDVASSLNISSFYYEWEARWLHG